jgi:hypothetical protein
VLWFGALQAHRAVLRSDPGSGSRKPLWRTPVRCRITGAANTSLKINGCVTSACDQCRVTGAPNTTAIGCTFHFPLQTGIAYGSQAEIAKHLLVLPGASSMAVAYTPLNP